MSDRPADPAKSRNTFAPPADQPASGLPRPSAPPVPARGGVYINYDLIRELREGKSSPSEAPAGADSAGTSDAAPGRKRRVGPAVALITAVVVLLGALGFGLVWLRSSEREVNTGGDDVPAEGWPFFGTGPDVPNIIVLPDLPPPLKLPPPPIEIAGGPGSFPSDPATSATSATFSGRLGDGTEWTAAFDGTVDNLTVSITALSGNRSSGGLQTLGPDPEIVVRPAGNGTVLVAVVPGGDIGLTLHAGDADGSEVDAALQELGDTGWFVAVVSLDGVAEHAEVLDPDGVEIVVFTG